MKKIFTIISGIVGFCFFAVALAGLFVLYQIQAPLSGEDGEKAIVIKKGMGIKEIAGLLEKENLIRGAFYFETYVWLKDEKNLQAGEYDLSPSMDIPEIVEYLTGGKVNKNEVRITIPEGFNLKEIDARLAATGLIKPGDLISFNPLAATSHLPLATSLEGYLFPDTYIFNKNSTLEQIVAKMRDNFDGKVTSEMREEIERQGKTLNQVIVMASIIQQEAFSNGEMPKVAGVFSNRLAINMALQSDATVNYVTGKGMRQPLLADTEINSPYNTYKYRGLPPGPICNPGLDAIKAAIYPEKHDYFYFLHPLDAPTVFSKTLDEHNANKAKWLK